MNIEMNGGKLPDDLEKKLQEALHAFALFCHEKSKNSHVIIELKHMSDSLAKMSSTVIAAAGFGVPIERQDEAEKEMNGLDPAKAAQEAIERALAEAKKKSGGDK